MDAQQIAKWKFCPKCRAAVFGGFCTDCGTDFVALLTRVSGQKRPAPAPAPAPVPDTETEDSNDDDDDDDDDSTSDEEEKETEGDTTSVVSSTATSKQPALPPSPPLGNKFAGPFFVSGVLVPPRYVTGQKECYQPQRRLDRVALNGTGIAMQCAHLEWEVTTTLDTRMVHIAFKPGVVMSFVYLKGRARGQRPQCRRLPRDVYFKLENGVWFVQCVNIQPAPALDMSVN